MLMLQQDHDSVVTAVSLKIKLVLIVAFVYQFPTGRNIGQCFTLMHSVSMLTVSHTHFSF